YMVLHVVTGKWDKVTPFMYIISACFIVNFLMR
ncbi:hypothetical protein EVA_12051, partial [gut metagenome]